MTPTFWIKRGLLVLVMAFAVIGSAQYFKTRQLDYALSQAAIWGVASTVVYLIVLWRKLRKNPACAIKATKPDA